MSNYTKNRSPQGNMHDPRKMRSPKMNPQCSKAAKSRMQTASNSTRTGDVVSDESEIDNHRGDGNTPENDDDSDDEPNAFALSGAPGPGRNGQRLAGLDRKHAQLIDEEDAIAGAVDDDDYGGVEDVSDSEDDDSEKVVLRAAEQELIAEFESQRPETANSMSNGMTGLTLTEDEDAALARRLSLQSDDGNDIFEELDFSQDPFGGLSASNSVYQQILADAEEDLASWRSPAGKLARENSMQSNGNEKKVRFAETVSSRSSSLSSEDEDPRDTFPDLFDEAEDPMLRSQFLMDTEMAIDDDNASEFEYDLDQYEKGTYHISQESDDSDSDISSSDSEDDGDTTDEEDPADQLVRLREIKAKQAAKRGPLPPTNTPVSTPTTPVGSRKSSIARPGKLKVRSKPMSGTFEHDPTQAHVKADVNGSGVRLVGPTKPSKEEAAFFDRARQAHGRNGSPGGAFEWTVATPRAQSAPQRPFTAKSTLGTMFDGNLDFLRHNDNSGIATEFLLQATRNSSVRSSFASSDTMRGSSQDIDGSDVDMGDFVHGMEESESEADNESPPDAVLSPTSDGFPDFAHDTSPMHQSAGAVEHLSAVNVSSFRNNQQRARQISSLAAHPAQRAQTSEANALQKGRRAAANTPMTPVRKNRGSQDLTRTGAGVAKSSASPLVQKHRRSRGNSLSQTLSLDRFADARKH
ncbi:uncharacterized protein MYCFIDRAFT_89221 [Pseudocercospora fijiensis CIRAD86]|uniref:Uncharacterized protein n=1 Tax=Pseudocercospora fijiensis (strain CIRAD86) TaxID=383855 RepID=N1Q9S1_PSEFD|nr:uncharacterized protein MYCFIDRAFT_89221 [Pseudocercospora fijiensis CIRAD86]EME88556.1 hypothetical protein MYCFIDRAFT_89221 [Pseudocercospora fijiensis CIRAD86]